MIENKQPISKKDRTDKSFLHVKETFYTIQGEGMFSGRRAVFIRLAGCNLQCPFCDTDYTLTDNQDKILVDDIIRSVDSLCKGERGLVVITGGEPFRQDISELTNKLVKNGFTVQVETNGTLYLDGFPYEDENVHIVCSPKTGAVKNKLKPYIDAYKYVLQFNQVSDEDGLPITCVGHPAQGKTARPENGKPVFVTPLDEQDEHKNILNKAEVVNSAIKYGYTAQIQLHKHLGVL